MGSRREPPLLDVGHGSMVSGKFMWFDLRLAPDKLMEPLNWKAPKMIFVNSTTDLSPDGVTDEYIVGAARVMQTANWHTYQVLTKRSERLRNMLNSKLQFAANLPHIWWGVSVDDKKYGLPRLEHLRASAATMKFLSIEPLLEDLGKVDLAGVDWVIVGGEVLVRCHMSGYVHGEISVS